MVTISDKKVGVDANADGTIDYYLADVVTANDYYPFGMLMPNRTFSTPSYRYGFNGKENDNEVKGNGAQYDYGFRVYDPRIGKFLSVDPLTKSYPMLTPYQYASNTPISSIDLDGSESKIVVYAETVLKDKDNQTLKTTASKIAREQIIQYIAQNLILPDPQKNFYVVTNQSSYVGFLDAGTRSEVISGTINEFIKVKETTYSTGPWTGEGPKGIPGKHYMEADFNYAGVVDNSSTDSYNAGIAELSEIVNSAATVFGELKDGFERDYESAVQWKNLEKGFFIYNTLDAVISGDKEAMRDQIAEVAQNRLGAFIEKRAQAGVFGTSMVRAAGTLAKGATFLTTFMTMDAGLATPGETYTQKVEKGRKELRNQVISAMLLYFMINNEPNVIKFDQTPRSPASSTGRSPTGDF